MNFFLSSSTPWFLTHMVISSEILRDHLCPRVHSLVFMLLPHQVGVIPVSTTESNTFHVFLAAVSRECLLHWSRGQQEKEEAIHIATSFKVIHVVMPGFSVQLAPASFMYPSWQILKDHNLFATSPIEVRSNYSPLKTDWP